VYRACECGFGFRFRFSLYGRSFRARQPRLWCGHKEIAMNPSKPPLRAHVAPNHPEPLPRAVRAVLGTGRVDCRRCHGVAPVACFTGIVVRRCGPQDRTSGARSPSTGRARRGPRGVAGPGGSRVTPCGQRRTWPPAARTRPTSARRVRHVFRVLVGTRRRAARLSVAACA
jgi:hypothetical protein